ncbi:unnamed protein product [Caenorhabditis brenneri]
MSVITHKPEFNNVDSYQKLVDEFFELTEIEKDVFSPTTLTSSRQLHPSVTYGVDTRVPVTYHVRRIRDGRSFANRNVDASQNSKICFVLQCSFNVEGGQTISHQSDIPKVPAPEMLMPQKDVVPEMMSLVESGKMKLPFAMQERLEVYDQNVYSNEKDLFEMRCTNLGNYYGFASDYEVKLSFWMKARGELNNDERLHRWLIAYNSDFLLSNCVVTPHYSSGLNATMLLSLDHCVWFHESQVRADEWLLIECESRIANKSRGLIEGRIWTRDGTLIATCQQEVLVRSKEGETSKL